MIKLGFVIDRLRIFMQVYILVGATREIELE